MPSSICQWIGKEVKEEGVLLEPAANLPSLLRCIIQCFSHNSLRFEGLSFPQPCGGQSANMKEAQNPRCCSFRLSGSSLSVILVWFIQLVHPWRETRTPVDELGNIFVLVRIQPPNLAKEVCRHHCGLSEWHWSSLTSHWWLVLLLLQRGSPLSQCTSNTALASISNQGRKHRGQEHRVTLPVPPSAVRFESSLKKLCLFSSSLHPAAITVFKCLKHCSSFTSPLNILRCWWFGCWRKEDSLVLRPPVVSCWLRPRSPQIEPPHRATGLLFISLKGYIIETWHRHSHET